MSSKKELLAKNIYNQVVYTIIQKDRIKDISGNTIALYKFTTFKIHNNRKVKASIYETDNKTFELLDNQLFLNNEFVGYVSSKQEKRSSLLLPFLACILSLATIIFVSLIGITPVITDSTIVFQVEDNNGLWEEQGVIAVLDNKINPGSFGFYDFIMSNESQIKLQYSFFLNEKYNGNIDLTSFMEYRLKMNNEYIKSDKWLKVESLNFDDLVFLPNTKQLMTLEWRWPFESDNDENDTLYGKDGGNYIITLNLKARVYSDET